MSALWDPIFGSTAVVATTDDRAWLQALCDAEAALARACAASGLIDGVCAKVIGDACAEVAITDPAQLGQRGAPDGNPVIALVGQLRARVPDHAADVHHGATSQDILDTAAMIVTRDALALITASLEAIGRSCVRLAAEHRLSAMIGRTLMQQAVPTTFGAVAASWGEGIDRALAQLQGIELAVQLGGAAGTLAGWHPHGPAVRAAFAAELGLHDPGTVWHAERTRIADIAVALGRACGVVAKIAVDVLLLAQTEIGEVHEDIGGASSAMAHKRNPIAAITARAAAVQAPGLVATLLAAMPGELQRGAGPWHAEWRPLIALLDASGGAANRLATCLAGLHVDTDAMQRNLAQESPDLGHAGDLVDSYLSRHSP